jgi:uncharacterized ferritin-like protein (DUF455 family)
MFSLRRISPSEGPFSSTFYRGWMAVAMLQTVVIKLLAEQNSLLKLQKYHDVSCHLAKGQVEV